MALRPDFMQDSTIPARSRSQSRGAQPLAQTDPLIPVELLKGQAALPQLQAQMQHMLPLFVQPFAFPPPQPIPHQGGETQPVSTHKDIPGDFPYTADWLVNIANSPLGDDMPWEACIKPLVDAHYFRIHQIERLSPEAIFEICKDVIKLPTASLMKDYVVDECKAIQLQKARCS